MKALVRAFGHIVIMSSLHLTQRKRGEQRLISTKSELDAIALDMDSGKRTNYPLD